jgi:hypothetical protein
VSFIWVFPNFISRVVSINKHSVLTVNALISSAQIPIEKTESRRLLD